MKPFLITILCTLYFYSIAQKEELILAIAKNDGKYGIIDTTGNWYISNIYNHINEISEGYVHAVTFSYHQEGFIHLKTKAFIPFDSWKKSKKIQGFDSLSVNDETVLYRFMENGHKYYKAVKESTPFLDSICLSKQTLTKPNYTFKSGIAPVWIGEEMNLKWNYSGGLWGYINEQGRWLFKPGYQVGLLPSERVVLLGKQDTFRYFNLKDSCFIPGSYNSGGSFKEGLAFVGKGDSIINFNAINSPLGLEKGKWGYINKKGEVVIPLIYDWASDFKKGYALVKKGEKEFYINQQGKHFLVANTHKENEIIKVDSLYGIKDKKGKWIFKPQFSNIHFISDKGKIWYVVEENNLWGFLDENFNWVKEPVFKNYRNHDVNIISVQLNNNKWTLLNLNGEFVTQNEFDLIFGFKYANQKNCINCLLPKKVYPPPPEYE